MSLFVGNISRNVSLNELESEFNRFGQCRLVHRGSYAFVEYQNERDGHNAKHHLHGRNMGGLCLNIEWSKRSGRFDQKEQVRKPPAPQKQEKVKDTCYNCGKIGHISRDCREAPECYECGGQGHIAKECKIKDRQASRSPRRDVRMSPGSRYSSSERSYSIDNEFLTDSGLNKLLLYEIDNQQIEIPEQSTLEITENELRSNPIQSDHNTIMHLTTQVVQEVQEDSNELIMDDGSNFKLEDSSAGNPESFLFRCMICNKQMLKSSIKRHITTKTHKEKIKKN